jgi:hypothetical protein
MALVVIGATFHRTRVEIPVVNGHAVDEHRLARTTFIAPLRWLHAVVDAELNVPVICLAAGCARVIEQTEIESLARIRIVFADQVARIVIHVLRGKNPQGE